MLSTNGVGQSPMTEDGRLRKRSCYRNRITVIWCPTAERICSGWPRLARSLPPGSRIPGQRSMLADSVPGRRAKSRRPRTSCQIDRRAIPADLARHRIQVAESQTEFQPDSVSCRRKSSDPTLELRLVSPLDRSKPTYCNLESLLELNERHKILQIVSPIPSALPGRDEPRGGSGRSGSAAPGLSNRRSRRCLD